RFDEPGLLAADVGARASMHPEVEIEAAAEDVFAEEILFASFFKRAVQNLRALSELAADVNVSELHVVRPTREDHPFDELVRVFVDDLAVLERARLGFVGVANEVNRLAAFAVHERPLESAGKSRAAATAQAGLHDLVAHLFLRRYFLAVGQIL